MSSKKVIVIGSGLGGLSAAISLKQSGYEVEVFEKNAQIGGKLNVLKEKGFSFDLGPSILTLPHIFERLFERSGKRMSDYFSIRALRPHWRSFFEDGVTLDLYPEPEKMAAEARKVGEPPENCSSFSSLICFGRCTRGWRRICKHATSATSSTSSSNTSDPRHIAHRRL
ncbi:MAG: NAD(P)-binding protein [Verrucomicrobia bacterium]|nr:NAD(P)-binding protein [Verrucomicrobiota bacterium]